MNYKIYEFKTKWEYLGTDIYKINGVVKAQSKNRACTILHNKLNETRLEYGDNFKGIQQTKLIFKNMSINNFEIKEYESMEIDGDNKDTLERLIIYEGYSGIGDFEMEKYKYDGVKEEWFHYDKHHYYTDIWYPSRYSK